MEKTTEKRPGRTFDAVTSARNRLETDEAWVEVSQGPFSFRAGRLYVSWGTGSLYNPSDVLCSRDLRDFIRTEQLGVWAARARLSWPVVSLEAYVLPVPDAHRLPSITSIDDDGTVVALGERRIMAGRHLLVVLYPLDQRPVQGAHGVGDRVRVGGQGAVGDAA